MTKDEELSRYMILIENYKEQLNSLDMQYSYLQAAIADYNKAKITLEQLIKADDGTEVLLPIGGSTFVSATAKSTSKVLFDIGGGIVTEKTSEDAIKKIDKRIESLQQTQEKLSSMAQQLQTEATQISDKAQRLLEEKKE
ncbi:MAG: prefoldin subunit alpha [Euryarchaeota archaeon]|jgi:prefoldin alpha subunit|nr:prefoldin subunit alpha [Euryarchaeota archaeon]